MPNAKTSADLEIAFNLASHYPAGWKTGTFRNDENKDIYYAKAEAYGIRKGAVVFVPGYGDSINFQYDAIRNWQIRGFDVYAMDWIGQGLSARENPENLKASNERMIQRHMLDLHKFMTDVVPKNESGPLYFAGHSMGATVGALYTHYFPEAFDRAILVAPPTELNTSILPRTVFNGLVSVANKVGLEDNPLPNWRHFLNRFHAVTDNIRELTNRPEELTLTDEASERMRKLLEPVQADLPTFGWVHRLNKSINEMREKDFFPGIKTPLLFVLAGRDELVDNDASRRAAKLAQNGSVLEIPTASHGVWNSTGANRELLWEGIDTWIAPDTGVMPSRRPQVAPQPTPQRRPEPAGLMPAFA